MRAEEGAGLAMMKSLNPQNIERRKK